MIRRALSVALMFCAFVAHAQDDPTIMTINGRPVSRSEFEYSYNKNNTDNVVDKKTVAQYVELFVNYKLKVEAALAARLDSRCALRSLTTTMWIRLHASYTTTQSSALRGKAD